MNKDKVRRVGRKEREKKTAARSEKEEERLREVL